MIKVKIIAAPHNTPEQLEENINAKLKILQEDLKAKIIDVEFSNFEAMIVYDDNTKKKKVLNEKV